MTAAQAESTPLMDSEPALVAQKRKLSDVEVEPKTNGVASDAHPSETPEPSLSQEDLKNLFSDIFAILENHDPLTSILNHSLLEPDESDEPSTKRAKLSDDIQSRTIASKLTNDEYTSIDALKDDITKVCEEILKPIREKESAFASGPYGRSMGLSAQDKAVQAQVLAFQTVVRNLLQPSGSKSSGKPHTNGSLTNGIKSEEDVGITLEHVQPVLSIFANAQGPKQLFSSFQEPYRVSAPQKVDSKELDLSVDVVLPLQESALPNFITLSKRPNVVVKGKINSSQTRTRALGELSTPGSIRSVPPLQVPKPSNRLITKSSSVFWVSPEKLKKPTSNRYNWAIHKQSYGKWLSYNGVDSPQDPNSPEAKRRQRDRALSIGAPNPPQSEASRLAEEQAKEDALFRSVFSSFAPSVDNTAATVPDSTRNEIWWDKIGQNRAQRVFVDPALLGDDEADTDDLDLSFDDNQLDELVESFNPELLQAPDKEQKDEDEQDDVGKQLQAISDLIDTLYSYQKIRLSQVPSTTTPVTPVGARPSLTEMIGTPSTPSTAEIEVQRNLKTKLAMLVLQLPPHAVTRMKGEKYGDLAFSTTMLLETEDDHGIMEEAVQQSHVKTPLIIPQTQPPARRMATSFANHSSTGGQYSRTPAAAPVPGRGNSTYYPQTQPQSTRTPSISYPRTSGGVSGNSQTWSGGYPAGQPSSVGTPTYNQTPARPNYNQNGQYHQPLQTQLGASRGPSFGSYYQPNTPQANYARQYQQTPLQNYSARPSAPTPTYGYPPQAVASPHIRTASPMQSGQGAASPAQYSRPGSAQATRSQYYGPPQAAAIGPSGFHSSMSAHEQQALMDRQRAQAQVAYQTNQARLAAVLPAANPPGAQPVAAYTPPRQLSNTPQPPATGQQVNGN